VNSSDLFPALSRREGEVFQLHQEGKTAKEISVLLQISNRTVEDILYKARKKLRAMEYKKRDITITLENVEKGMKPDNDKSK
jgi:DNA-binding NarL/FixJ family response regulator